jgi:hypothetical protein
MHCAKRKKKQKNYRAELSVLIPDFSPDRKST